MLRVSGTAWHAGSLFSALLLSPPLSCTGLAGRSTLYFRLHVLRTRRVATVITTTTPTAPETPGKFTLAAIGWDAANLEGLSRRWLWPKEIAFT